MFSEPQTPVTFLEDSFSEINPPVSNLRLSGASETIQAKLNRRLGPEYVSQRPAPGGGPKLTYIEGWKIIGLANEVFGYNGWSSTVTRLETDFTDMDPESRRWNVGITAIVKITLKDGTFHEDVGYGTGENLRSKGAALDKAKKEAVTDGVKRALRNFGNLLGLCLYEKSFTQEVVKIRPQLPTFNESDLHRRAKSVGPSASGSGTQDVTSTTFAHPAEDRKLIASVLPQMRPAHSKPSPLRNAISAYSDGQRRGTTPRMGVGTTGEGPSQLKHQEAGGLRIAPLAKTHTLRPDEILPREVQPPQQGPSSERNVTSVSSPRQFDAKRVPPSALKAADSDIDIYFNDEDNDALLALEDSALQDAESHGSMTTRITSIDHNVDRSSTKNEFSPGGTRPQAAASVSTSNNRNSAPPPGQPMSALRQAIRASTFSLAMAGVKRPVEAIQSPHPQPARVGVAQRLAAGVGGREVLGDLPVEGADVKRMKF